MIERLRTVLWTLQEQWSVVTGRLRFNHYRRTMATAGVYIHRDARFAGGDGISIGADSVIHAGAILSAGALHPKEYFGQRPAGSIRIGRRCSIYPGVILSTYGGDIVIGDDVSINPGVVIYGHGGVTIGDKARIGAQALIVASAHNYTDANVPVMDQGMTQKGIVIGPDVWIASGAKVFDGVSIGRSAVVSAGAVVHVDVPEFTVVAGVPARAISKRRPGSEQ